MKRLASVAAASLVLGLFAADAAAVPGTVTLTARVSDGSGPINGTVNLGFQIYSAASGGTLLWEETYSGVSANQGLVYVNLGSQDPLDLTVFDGAAVYLQVSVNASPQSPRLPINSVPYAIHSAAADTASTLGTLAPGDVALSSHNHTGVYAPVSHNHDASYAAISHNHDTSYYTQSTLNSAGTINAGGNPVDWTKLKNVPAGIADGVDNDSGGDITGITTAAGSGLSGGAASGNVTLSVDTTTIQKRVTGTCAAGNAIRVIDVNGNVTCEPVGGSSLGPETGTNVYMRAAVQANSVNSQLGIYEYLQYSPFWSTPMYVASASGTTAITSGQTIRFGCQISNNGTLIGNNYTCQTAWMCSNGQQGTTSGSLTGSVSGINYVMPSGSFTANSNTNCIVNSYIWTQAN